MKTQSVYILGNPDKTVATAVIEELRAFIGGKCTLVGAELSLDGTRAVRAGAAYIVVVGGDGSLIGVARSLGKDQLPLIGVNVGKLGFLAEFSASELKSVFDRAVTDPSLINRRTVLHATVKRGQQERGRELAINDVVIQAGPPFRMIHLGLSINGQRLTDLAGDGLIVCTPSGSTAHNLSAGGPIMQPGVEAIIVTPLCPHSLTHKPLVVERECVVDINAERVNAGSMVIVDGQVALPLEAGDCVTVRRFEADALVVRNPLYPNWHKLVNKLHWGQAPTYE